MSKVHVEILRKAQRLISSHNEDFICYAVQHSCECEEQKQILNAIKTALQGLITVHLWLSVYHGINLNHEDRRIYRMAWIDKMIEYWKDKQ